MNQFQYDLPGFHPDDNNSSERPQGSVRERRLTGLGLLACAILVIGILVVSALMA